MRNVLRSLVLSALIAPAAAAVMMIASPAQAAVAAKPTEKTLQAEVNRLVNVERTSHGCAPLTENKALTAAARTHSAWMAQT
ncbi:CAP domain-containing protein, partial [Actinoplanes rectilineatus]|uniref:CAP domain-containing protein n=1 Tax=Actinoplanes rectilineatus TaxID=113571 RepID=UPI00316AE372